MGNYNFKKTKDCPNKKIATTKSANLKHRQTGCQRIIISKNKRLPNKKIATTKSANQKHRQTGCQRIIISKTKDCQTKRLPPLRVPIKNIAKQVAREVSFPKKTKDCPTKKIATTK